MYDLLLRRTIADVVQTERLEAKDDNEARSLAELRLKLTSEFAEVVLSDARGPIAAYTRDSSLRSSA